MNNVIKVQNITCEYKKWFRHNHAYLTLDLLSNGHWFLKVNKHYQKTELTVSDWKRIKLQCEEKIKLTQKYVLKNYKTQKFYKSCYTSDSGKIETSIRKCYEIINTEYDLLFEGRI